MKRSLKHYRIESNSEEAMINLTPLIDVVFVMLIMFIVVAPILELDQVELAHGHPGAQEVSSSIKDSSPISIHVQKDNTICFNQKKVSIPELKKLLSDAHIKHPKATPLLFHDKKAFFGTYQEVKNSLEEAGFKDLNVVLSP